MTPRIIATISEADAKTLLLALLILLVAALAGAKAAALLRIPRVAGEIVGGIVIGPTLLGRFFPDAYGDVFGAFAGEGQALSVFYWLGLILLMFTSGYEVEMKGFREDRKIIGWLLAGSTILPLFAGYYAADIWFVEAYIGRAGHVAAFNLVFAIAVAVTSIPVISKIFLDLGLIKHRFARIVLVTATMQDLFLWVILSIAGGLAAGKESSAVGIASHIAVTILMFCFAMFVAPLFGGSKWLGKLAVFSYDSMYFILCLLCICLGGMSGVNIMYSAFVAGLLFRNIRNAEAAEAQRKIRDLSLAVFTPVYFAIVGLRIHLTGDFGLGLFLAFLMTASVLELAGSILSMRIAKLDWLSSVNLGIAMNARGGPGIVLATVTYEMGIVNYDFFCALILVTLITSTAAGWWIAYVNRKGLLLPAADAAAP